MESSLLSSVTKSISLHPDEAIEVIAGRRTQIRRVVNPQPFLNRPEGILRGAHIEGDFCWPHPNNKQVRTISNSISKPGGPDDYVSDFSPWRREDRLWVKERWRPFYESDTGVVGIQYSHGESEEFYGEEKELCLKTLNGTDRWRPSTHLPKWAARTVIKVVDVWIERLHAISRDDCRLQGCRLPLTPADTTFYDGFDELRSQFAMQWDIDNKEYHWAKNPWVWVISFNKL
jgi:hypothetical protein